MSKPVSGPIPGWYVVFDDHDHPVWFQRFLRKGFRHCYAFGWDAMGERWIYINPTFEGAALLCFDDPTAHALIKKLRADGCRILYARTESRSQRLPRPLVTCVSVVEALLGLRTVCAVTPYRLFRILRAHGAQEIGG